MEAGRLLWKLTGNDGYIKKAILRSPRTDDRHKHE